QLLQGGDPLLLEILDLLRRRFDLHLGRRIHPVLRACVRLWVEYRFADTSALQRLHRLEHSLIGGVAPRPDHGRHLRLRLPGDFQLDPLTCASSRALRTLTTSAYLVAGLARRATVTDAESSSARTGTASTAQAAATRQEAINVRIAIPLD